MGKYNTGSGYSISRIYIPFDLSKRYDCSNYQMIYSIILAVQRKSYKVLEYLLTLEEMVSDRASLAEVYAKVLEDKQYNLALAVAKLLGVLYVLEFLNYYITNTPVQDPYFIQKIKQSYDFTKFDFCLDCVTKLPAVESNIILQDLNEYPERCLGTNFEPFKFNAQGISIYGYLKLYPKLYPSLLNFIEKNLSYFNPEIILLDNWLDLLKYNKIEDLLKFAKQGKFGLLCEIDKYNFLFELIEYSCMFDELPENYLKLIEIFTNSSGVNINYIDEKMGCTLLHQAARLNHPDLFRILIANGGDLNLENVNGHMPIDIAENFSNTEVVSLIKNYSLSLRPKGSG